MKTPDEIKDQLLKEVTREGKIGSTFNIYQLRTLKSAINKAFSLGVEEGYNKACEDIINILPEYVNKKLLVKQIRKLQEGQQ